LERLEASGKWYVVENVPNAPLRPDVILCGSHFGLEVRRHRWFQSNFRIDQPRCNHAKQGKVVTVHGHPGGSSSRDQIKLPSFEDWQRAMNIRWMTVQGLSQAIPPAYTRYIGGQYLEEDV
jgi:DNA (cytosine-5)-methyltransferase 1